MAVSFLRAGVPGVEGQAFWCAPGTSIRLPSAMILPQKGDFTFCFYAGFPLPFTGGQMLAYNPKMSVFLTPEGKFGATLARTTLSGGASVADGRWHHVAVTYEPDGNGNTLCKFYRDYVQLGATKTFTGELECGDHGTSSFAIGSRYNGYIDEVRISKGVLTVDQMLHVHKGGLMIVVR